MSLTDCIDEYESSDDISRKVPKGRRSSSLTKPIAKGDPTQYSETIGESLEERQALFEQLRKEYTDMICKEKPAIIFAQEENEVTEGTTLEDFLQKHGPFPVEEHIAAGIIRSVSSAIMFLHCREVVHGCLDFTSVVLDRYFNAKTIVSSAVYRVKSSKAAGARGKVEDVFHVGLLLYRLLTGHKAKFGQNGELLTKPSPYMRISEKGMKLVEFMFATNLRFPPTIGRVRYSDWLDECDENPPVFVLFPS
uniref:Serine/threonine protein kinase PrkC n=1 Tax=Haemonchus contortus TaxID=6289 RepID=A0A7I4YJM4_HAECO